MLFLLEQTFFLFWFALQLVAVWCLEAYRVEVNHVALSAWLVLVTIGIGQLMMFLFEFAFYFAVTLRASGSPVGDQVFQHPEGFLHAIEFLFGSER